jgi:hypothetical protein
MKTTPLIALLITYCVCSGYGSFPALGQSMNVLDFLEQKQTLGQKLIVVYAPDNLRHLAREQYDLMYPFLNQLKDENIAVVQIPNRLSPSSVAFLEKKLHYHADRLNIWVIDERGILRMSGTKVTTVSQFFRVLNLQTRPEAIMQAYLLSKK